MSRREASIVRIQGRPTRCGLPNHKISAGPALERCYEKVQIASERALQLSNWIGCIITDACGNTNNESIVNYMIVADQLSQFLESVATEEQSHTAASGWC